MTTFDLNRTNVKKIICIKDHGAYDLKRVVDINGNVLWQSSIPTRFANCYFYTSMTEDNSGSLPGAMYYVNYSLINDDTGAEITDVPSSRITEQRFYKNTDTGEVVYASSNDMVSLAYQGWYYGCTLTFSGYDGDDNAYEACSYTFLGTQPVHSMSDYTYLLKKTSTGYTAYLDERLYPYADGTAWTWYILTTPGSIRGGIILDGKYGGTSSSYTFAELRAAVAGTELATISPLYVYCELSVDTGEVDSDGDPVVGYGYYYSDESFENLISISVPKAVSRTYDGTAQYGCDSGTGYTRSGTGTNAGSHTTKVSLKSGYIWSDGTTADKTINWTMKKASFTKVELRLGTSSPHYVQWRVNGPNCAAGKSFKVEWSISNTNGSVTQPRASGSDSYTASDNGNLVVSNTGTYTSQNPSTYKYYGTWKFAGSTNFNAFTFTCSKSNAKKIERGTYVTVAS